MKCVCVTGRGTRNGWTWSSRAAEKGENICLNLCLNVTFLEALWHLNAPFLCGVPPHYLKCKNEAQISPLSDRLLCCWSRSVRTWLRWWGLRAWSARSEVCRLFCELRTFPNINKNIPCVFTSGMDPRAPLPPGVSMLPAQKQRIPPPPGEDGREVIEF